MRDFTTLPFVKLPHGREWNGKDGNYSPENFRGPVELIVLHTTVGSLKGTAAWFNNPQSKVGANYVIEEGTVYGLTPEKYVSFNSGVWDVNQRSVSIEHVDNGNPQGPRSNALYEASAQLVADIAKYYNIPLDRDHVKKHSEIKATACPGNLDVDRIVRRAIELTHPSEPVHSYDMKPSDFVRMVQKSTEYDELWKNLQLPMEEKTKVGSHKTILAGIQRLQEQAAQAQETPVPSKVEVEVPSPAPAVNTPTAQANSVWKSDVKDLLSRILAVVSLRK